MEACKKLQKCLVNVGGQRIQELSRESLANSSTVSKLSLTTGALLSSQHMHYLSYAIKIIDDSNRSVGCVL